MRVIRMVGVLVAAIAAAGCGGNDEPEEEPMKVEDTVFGDLIGTQDTARDGANAAVDTHREALKRRLDADEGAPPEE